MPAGLASSTGSCLAELRAMNNSANACDADAKECGTPRELRSKPRLSVCKFMQKCQTHPWENL